MKYLLSLAACMLAIVGFVGCNQSEPGGKPKDNKSDNRMSIPTPGANKEAFTMKAPTLATKIKQGDRQTVKLTLDRGSEFKSDVSLKVDAPKGVTVELDPKTVKASDGETVNVTVTAAKDAALGDHTVSVTGTPKDGKATDVSFKVTVEKKGE